MGVAAKGRGGGGFALVVSIIYFRQRRIKKIETTNKQTNDGSENLQHSHDLLGVQGGVGTTTPCPVCGNSV